MKPVSLPQTEGGCVAAPLRLVCLVLAFLIAIPGAASLARADEFRIGVLAYRGKAQAAQRWQGHADYLNERLAPHRFVVMPLSYDEIDKAVADHALAFLITNSGHFTEFEMAGTVSALATRQLAAKNGALDRFGGVLITLRGRTDIRGYADLAGKRVLIPDRSSLGGWQVHLADEAELIFHHQLGERRVRHRLEPALARSPEAKRLAAALGGMSDLFDRSTFLVRKEQRTRVDGPVGLVESVLQFGRKGLSIQRYKGLGEMNPGQLWETTLDPEVRSLVKVGVEHTDQAADIFATLMGDVVEPRREFIQDNALKVVNLDI